MEELQQRPVWLQEEEDGEAEGPGAAKLEASTIAIPKAGGAAVPNGTLGDLVSFEAPTANGVPHNSQRSPAPPPAPVPKRDPLEDLLSLSTVAPPAPIPAAPGVRLVWTSNPHVLFPHWLLGFRCRVLVGSGYWLRVRWQPLPAFCDSCAHPLPSVRTFPC